MKKRKRFLTGDECSLFRRILKIMKLTTFILLATSMMVSASLYSQSTRLTLKLNDISYEELFKEIENQTEFRFAFSDSKLDPGQKVNINVTKGNLEKILDKALPDGIAYEIIDRYVVIMNASDKKVTTENQQQKSITGTVTNESGQPLPGVTIVVKGTTKGAVTNADGNYSLGNVPSDATLVFSFIGMKTQEIPVSGKTNINVILAEDAIGIEEVVAIGYGTLKKRNLTSSISQVSSKDIKNSISTRIEEALQGKLAGVIVQQASGLPGAAPVIRIRGTNSITEGNQPLWVIDGMPIEDAGIIANINMNDAESVEVLKDAAAAAIYGSRAANGVIIVTTKLGKTGKAKISYNMYYGTQSAEKRLDLLSGPEMGELLAEFRAWDWSKRGTGGPSVPNDDRPSWGRIDPNWLTGNVGDYDVQDEIFRNAPIQNHNISVMGGSENTKYFMSMNYFNQEGITVGTGFERFSLRCNIESNINDIIKIGLNVSASSSIQKDAAVEGKDQSINKILNNSALIDSKDFYFADDGFTFINDYAKYYDLTSSADILYGLKNLEQKFVRPQVLTNSFIELSIIDGLKFKTAGYYKYSGVHFTDRRDVILGRGNSSAHVTNSFSSNWSIESTLNYVKDIKKHSITGLLGYSTQKEHGEYTRIYGRGFANDLALSLNNATEISSWGESISEWSLISMFGRASYVYDSRYLATASIRRDGSSRFGSNNKWGYFPSLSAAWRINNEAFMADVNIISNLKLRASYGQTGNNRIGNYRSYATLQNANVNLGAGESVEGGLVPNSFENKELTWEKTTTTNIGLDIGLIKNRISLSVDVYEGLTNDLLLSVPLPLTSGFSSAIQNIGEVSNRGVEVELNTYNIKTQDFQWNTKLNFSYNKNEVLKMGANDAPILTGEWYAKVSYTGIGEAIGSFYMWETDGIFQNQEELDKGPIFKDEGIGDVRFVDHDGDGDVDADDRTILGQPMPKYHYGISNNFTYKNFDLSIFLNGAGGHKIYFIQSRYINRPNETRKNLLSRWANRWRSESQPGDGSTPKITSKTGTNGTDEEQDGWLYKGDWFRIKNVTIGYNLPKHMLEKLKISRLRVYASGENLFLKTGYIGYNTEGVFGPGIKNRGATQSESAASQSWGYDCGSLPLPRTLTLGLNVTF